MEKRTDHNQAEIVRLLRNAGASVAVLSLVGSGIPDLLIGWQGKNFLAEVKNLDGRGERLTHAELNFFESWRGQVDLVRNIEEALKLTGILEPSSLSERLTGSNT